MLSIGEWKAVIEGALFLAGDEGVSLQMYKKRPYNVFWMSLPLITWIVIEDWYCLRWECIII